VGGGGGVSVRVAEALPPPELAVIVTSTGAATAFVTIAKLPGWRRSSSR
jgi:hypothetical protein